MSTETSYSATEVDEFSVSQVCGIGDCSNKFYHLSLKKDINIMHVKTLAVLLFVKMLYAPATKPYVHII